jgi:hypothetical protein
MKQRKCKYCDKRIEGHTEKQVDYMLMQHMLSKHPEKVRIEE